MNHTPRNSYAMADPLADVRRQVADRLHELETRLIAHGFTVEVEAKLWCLTATARPDLLGPRRSQRVQLAHDAAGALNWYLVSPTEEKGIVRTDLIGPAADIATTVDRVAEALRGGEA